MSEASRTLSFVEVELTVRAIDQFNVPIIARSAMLTGDITRAKAFLTRHNDEWPEFAAATADELDLLRDSQVQRKEDLDEEAKQRMASVQSLCTEDIKRLHRET